MAEREQDAETRPSDARPSDAPVEPALTHDGALASTSEADGAGTAADIEVPEGDRPHQEPSDANRDALVEGNRVATADDME